MSRRAPRPDRKSANLWGGDLLRRARRRYEWTVARAAEYFGVSPDTYTKWETTAAGPKKDRDIVKVAWFIFEAFGGRASGTVNVYLGDPPVGAPRDARQNPDNH